MPPHGYVYTGQGVGLVLAISLGLLFSRVLGNAIGKNHVRHCLFYGFRLGHTADDAYRNFRSVLEEDEPCERTWRY